MNESAKPSRLHRIANRLEAPMVALAFVWIALMGVEMSGHANAWTIRIADAVWVIFVADFVLRLAIAPRKGAFLQRNLVTLLSLLLPALRVFRALRLVRAARGIRLFRVFASTNRTMRALMRSMGRKGFGYVAAMTLVVTYAGAAGMYALEPEVFSSYWDALWWTAMIVTTMGSESWPITPEGRLLCLALAIYAFSVFGYVTAALASFLVERDAGSARERSSLEEQLELMREEMARMREALAASSGRAG